MPKDSENSEWSPQDTNDAISYVREASEPSGAPLPKEDLSHATSFDMKAAESHFFTVNFQRHKGKVARPEIEKELYEGLGRRYVAVLGEIAVLETRVQSTLEGTARGWAARYLYRQRVQENEKLDALFSSIQEPWPALDPNPVASSEEEASEELELSTAERVVLLLTEIEGQDYTYRELGQKLFPNKPDDQYYYLGYNAIYTNKAEIDRLLALIGQTLGYRSVERRETSRRISTALVANPLSEGVEGAQDDADKNQDTPEEDEAAQQEVEEGQEPTQKPIYTIRKREVAPKRKGKRRRERRYVWEGPLRRSVTEIVQSPPISNALAKLIEKGIGLNDPVFRIKKLEAAARLQKKRLITRRELEDGKLSLLSTIVVLAAERDELLGEVLSDKGSRGPALDIAADEIAKRQ